jgi:hypothetical protein
LLRLSIREHGPGATKAAISLSPHSPSKTGVNALSLGRGSG